MRDAKLLNETVRVFRIDVLPGMPIRLREFRKTTVRLSISFVAVPHPTTDAPSNSFVAVNAGSPFCEEAHHTRSI